MDKEIIIYIIFLIIALLGRLMGGKKKKPVRKARPQTNDSDEPVKSFEELLEEFTSGKVKSKDPQRDLEEMDVPASAESRRRRKSARELIEDTEEYEEEDSPFSFEPQDKLRSIDEMVDIDKVKTRSTIQTVEEEEEHPEVEESTIRSMLQNPEDARKAIILGEILNRKYH